MDQERKRRNPANDVSGLREIYKKGLLAEEYYPAIEAYLDEIKAALHEEWEKLGTTEGSTAKTLHFHVKTINEIKRLMKARMNKGKIALNKLEEENG